MAAVPYQEPYQKSVATTASGLATIRSIRGAVLGTGRMRVRRHAVPLVAVGPASTRTPRAEPFRGSSVGMAVISHRLALNGIGVFFRNP